MATATVSPAKRSRQSDTERPAGPTARGNGPPVTNSKRPPAEVVEVPIELIDVPGENPRKHFEGIEQLAESVRTVGQLAPIVCRRANGGRFELVAGERRYRAAQLAGLPTILASIRGLDDKAAAEVRLVENLHRRDLQALEFAGALEQLQRFKHNIRSLAKLTGLAEEQIREKLSLLELPEVWRERVESGALPVPAAELLAPWCDNAEIVAELEAVFQASADKGGLPLIEWRARIVNAVLARSRSMDTSSPDGPQFDIDDAAIAALDVRDLVIRPGEEPEPRAMNVAEWDARQDSVAPLVADRFAGAAVPNRARDSRGHDDEVDVDRDEPESQIPDDGGETFDPSPAAYREALLNAIAEACESQPVDRLEKLAAELGVDVDGLQESAVERVG